jgi:alkaline phosphatase
MNKENITGRFVWNVTDFRKTDFKKYKRILGLLSYTHLDFECDRVDDEQPSLSEMTQKAIDFLSQNEKGYVLLVEGGRIDHGHHGGKALRALDDFVSFDDAIGKGLEMTSDEDTMIVVTADHSHTFTLSGYAVRGNPILGIAVTNYRGNLTTLNITATSLHYADGPGGFLKLRTTNLTDEICLYFFFEIKTFWNKWFQKLIFF